MTHPSLPIAAPLPLKIPQFPLHSLPLIQILHPSPLSSLVCHQEESLDKQLISPSSTLLIPSIHSDFFFVDQNSVGNGTVVFEPALNENGINYDSFDFVATDGQAFSSPATFIITVFASNDRPVAYPFSLSFTDVTVSFLGNFIEFSEPRYHSIQRI